MRRVRYSDAALRSLGEIFVHVRETSGSAAVGRRRVAAIRARCSQLAGLPGTMGRARSELGPDLRYAVSESHVIFFRYAGGDVFEVVEILDGHRDLDAYFGSGA
ncbi:type II toxin-antitoxin system RelE/ParE family toxin [Aureimonas leprariae]|uniref:Type II toxin-antitoxin system RelE/ParE family toxin n=1 Tax=Plantimonas leprariae TaxID=2615207 RepID=A0A7V7TY74_9HYPH|nr:type II toxin-antitoxin system RelE/ParE family toxin [Aureimonas leprariae]KAB0682682.1 type II toxin-antitoxin system RelE/ParE family toxin [Aureimonas leprariae]